MLQKKFTNHIYIIKKKKLPFVTGKLAISRDKYIYSKKKRNITNEYSKSITHLLRYRNDSILISNKTLNNDNPKLDCRIQGLSNFSPKRIILDRNLSIKKNSYIFQSSNNKNTIIFYEKASKNKIKQLINKGIKIIKLTAYKNNFFDLNLVLKKIYSYGCRNLLVEGGKSLTSSFLDDNLFNQFYLFKSSNKLGNKAKLNVSSQLNQLSFNYKKKSKLKTFTGNDIVYLYSK